MRILYIDVNCKGSSTGQIVYNLFSECKNNGLEAAVCYGRGPLIKEDGIYKFGIDLETKFHALMTRLTGYTGCFSFFSTRRLLRYIKRFKPDIVHIHELHAYFVNIKPLLLFLRKHDIKTIFTNHCEFLYTGKCGYSKECTRYSCGCGNCPSLGGYPKSLFFDKTSLMVSEKKSLFSGWKSFYLVTPSIWLKNKMSLSFFGNNDISVIHNGIDTSIYNIKNDDSFKDKMKIPHNHKIVLSLAPHLFGEMKGGYTFLEVVKAMANYPITFIAVGSDDEDLIEMSDNLIVLPSISNKDMIVDFYSNSDCFVILSKFENFPTTCLEAQCCGTKIVGFDVGGIKETILDGNGIVVQYNDIHSIENAILDILSQNYSKNDVSDKAIRYYSSSRMFDDYFKIYNKL